MRELFIIIIFAFMSAQSAWADCASQRASAASTINSCLSQSMPGCGVAPAPPYGPKGVRAVFIASTQSGVAFNVFCERQWCDNSWDTANSATFIVGLGSSCFTNLKASVATVTLQKPVNACGSIIQTSNQVVGESIGGCCEGGSGITLLSTSLTKPL